MANTLLFRCRSCGHSFSRTFGVDVNGQAEIYCSHCGRVQHVDLSVGWNPLPDCDCGGIFDPDALGSCPQCGSLLTKADVCAE